MQEEQIKGDNLDRKEFNAEVGKAIEQVSRLLCIYQSDRRGFEYSEREESAIKSALFTLVGVIN